MCVAKWCKTASAIAKPSLDDPPRPNSSRMINDRGCYVIWNEIFGPCDAAWYKTWMSKFFKFDLGKWLINEFRSAGRHT
ncbi:hypothetical protein OGAPHI_003587 [Ogataea philodendri]|uniref:Uncharacterized protein n=1 Tax=Ogataea philodendri TaxID=1378263 RepID=A0A9P8T3Z0_9ASCO|nr:uncharacterized protein OGAPHI_003587 [Ogataea philodendri]KAH3665403.1 hypothetical protein OGAPHI_003587 [Ogataea philodendri]